MKQNKLQQFWGTTINPANGIAKAIKYLTKNTNQEKLKRKRKWVLLEER